MGCACLKSNSSKETKSIFVINNSNENRQNNENNNEQNRQSIFLFSYIGNRQQIRNSANEERAQNQNHVRLNMNYNPDFNMPELGKKII
jgi:hypothetical protein